MLVHAKTWIKFRTRKDATILPSAFPYYVEIWEVFCEFLLHPHMWLHNISNRLVASYLKASKEDPESLKIGSLLLMKPSRLYAISVSVCCQLKAPLTDDMACKILTDNLIVSICGVHSLVGQSYCMDMHKFWSTLELHEQGKFLKAFEVLGSRKGKLMFACLTSGGKDSMDQADGEDLLSLLVSHLLKRMGNMSLQMEDIQMKIVLDILQMISSKIRQEGCQHHPMRILLPLYKVCEGFAGKAICDDMKQLAEEVRDSIKGIPGIEKFVQVCDQIRMMNLKSKRDKRKNEEKAEASN